MAIKAYFIIEAKYLLDAFIRLVREIRYIYNRMLSDESLILDGDWEEKS